MVSGERYEFGDFTLDVTERRLTHLQQPVKIPPKAYDVLVNLVRNAGRLQTKQELLDAVWPDSFVEEGILAVHVSALRKALGDKGRDPRLIETVARSGYQFTGAVIQSRTAPARWSLAILPSMPIEADEPGLGLIIADALITRLSPFSNLIVRPLRATRSFDDPRQDPAAAGRALQVDAVVHTSYRRESERLHVDAALVSSRDGTALWQNSFTGEAASVHDGIAGCITKQFAPVPKARPQTGPRPRAYELLGIGRLHLLSAARNDVPKAIAAFEAAVALEPDYVPALAGLALACCAKAEFRWAQPASAHSEAKSAALRALAVDDASSDAQTALGAVLFLAEWNWADAERCLRRAIERNPNNIEAYLLFGRLLEAMGRLDDGLSMKWHALERDPFSPVVQLQIALSYWNQRLYDESIEWAEKSLALDPRHLLAREHIAAAYWKKGLYDRHMEESMRHAESHGTPAAIVEEWMAIYSKGGRSAVLRHALSVLPQGAPSAQLALMYGELGELDTAFHHLDRAIGARDSCLVHLAVAPQWDALRADPRFTDRVRRMGLLMPAV